MKKLWSMFRPHRHRGSASIAHTNAEEVVVAVSTTSAQKDAAAASYRRDTPFSSASPRPNGESLDDLSSLDEDADFYVEYEDAEDDSPPPMNRIASPISIPVAEAAPAFYSGTEELTSIDSIPNLEAGSGSPRRSYLSIYPSTIQMIDARHTLFVWHATFHPAVGRRFSSIEVQIKFDAPPSRNSAISPVVQVTKFAPRKAYGATTREQKSISWGLELPVTVPAGPASIGVTPSTHHQTSKEVDHAFTIGGSARGTPLRQTCVWTISENKSSERGVPSELQLAALVQHSGPMQVEVDIAGRSAGGFYLPHHLRPKTDAVGRKKVIDPRKYRGVLDEFNLGEDKWERCGRLLNEWTGKVDGAMLQFDQPVMSA
jgi:hypothetical protein